MRVKTKFSVCVIVLSLVVSGCSVWHYVRKDNETWKNPPFYVQLPQGWSKGPGFGDRLLLLTKDGVSLERIVIMRHALNSDKEFPLTKKKILTDMLPQELSDLVKNEMSLDRENYLNFEVVENKPVRIGGVDGFRLIYSFNDDEFKKSKAIYYGFLCDKQFYSICYVAARQHYFDAGASDFAWFMDKLQIKSGAEKQITKKPRTDGVVQNF